MANHIIIESGSDSDLDLCDIELLSDKHLWNATVPDSISVEDTLKFDSAEETSSAILKHDTAQSLATISRQDSEIEFLGVESPPKTDSLGFISDSEDLPQSQSSGCPGSPAGLKKHKKRNNFNQDSTLSHGPKHASDTKMDTKVQKILRNHSESNAEHNAELDEDVDRMVEIYPHILRSHLRTHLTEFRKKFPDKDEAFQNTADMILSGHDLCDEELGQPALAFSHNVDKPVRGNDDAEEQNTSSSGELLDYDDAMETTYGENYSRKLKTDSQKPPRYSPYAGKGKRPLFIKGKLNTSGKTTQKSSSREVPTDVLDSSALILSHIQTGAVRMKTEPQPMTREEDAHVVNAPETNMECEACKVLRSTNGLVQCCGSHLVCTHCVEKSAKAVLVGEQKGSVYCPVTNCNCTVPQSELRKALPSIVLDLLEDKWKKETLEAVENMNDGVRCPGCGFSAVLDIHIKQLKCCKCNKCYCRHCELEWHLRPHDLCIKTTSRTLPDTGAVVQVPSHWIDGPDRDGYTEVHLEETSEEYLEISILFINSIEKSRSGCIHKIYRIQNQRLWEKYSLFRTHMVEDLGELHINEKRLFHGTRRDVIHPICKEGFDWRLSGKHGTAFGQGTYFAKDASYSDNYSSQHDGVYNGVLFGSRPAATGFTLGAAVTSQSNAGYAFGSAGIPSVSNSNTGISFFHGTLPQPTLMSHSNSGFTFGPQQQTNIGTPQTTTSSSTALSFGTPQANSNTNTGFGFGTQQANSNTNTGFRFGTQQANSNTNTGFGFGTQQANSNSNTIFGGSVFGSSSQPPTSNPNPVFHFTGNSNTNSNSSSSSGLGFGFTPHQGTNSNLFVKVIPARAAPSNNQQQAADNDDSIGNNFMFVGRVLVGRSCRGRSDMRRPERDPHDGSGQMCHSAVDNVNNPRIFVIFESSQCYPEYLIEYSSS